jgi:hypothetical protein
MKKFSLFCGMIVLCAAALIVFAGVDCLAGEQEGPTQITRVGGANAFFRAPDGLTAEAFKAMCVEKKEEITALLYEAGWQWGPEVFFDAVAAGQFKEVQFPVGGELEWMMFRKKGKPTLGYNFIWAGKEPLDAFEVTLNVDDTKDQKDYVYKFIVPRACSNIALYALDSTHYSAVTKAVLAVAPESGCVCTDFVIDATGSVATLKGKNILENVMAQVTMPDGTTEGLGAPDTPYKWKLNYKKPGTYKFKAVTVAGGKTGDKAATAVFEVLPCPPECDLGLDVAGDYDDEEKAAILGEFYTGEEIIVDASGSTAATGDLDKVAVKVYLDGDKIDDLDLGGDFTTTVAYDTPGAYKFEAEAFDTCDQDSDNDCDATLGVNSRWIPFVSLMAGKMRRSGLIADDLNDTVDVLGHCEPLVQIKAGVGYMVIPRKFSISGALGYAWAVDHTEFGSLFADVYFNYHHRPWMFGAGLGYWNLDDTDYGDFTLNLQGGIDLPWEIRDEPMQFVIELRSFLDEISDFGNNYLLVGGFQFNF